VVLDRAQVFPDVASAVADLHSVYATTARRRDMVKPVFTPRTFPNELQTAVEAGQKVGVLFGAERSGLQNEDVVRAKGIIEIPANPAFTSFNLAQAVLVVGYECFQARVSEHQPLRNLPDRELASADAVDALLEHLDRELDEAEYYREPNLRATMQRNLHNVFRRANLTDQEVRSLRGVVARLASWRARRPPKDR
jgi:tRNA/rRNA methyltransferase